MDEGRSMFCIKEESFHLEIGFCDSKKKEREKKTFEKCKTPHRSFEGNYLSQMFFFF